MNLSSYLTSSSFFQYPLSIGMEEDPPIRPTCCRYQACHVYQQCRGFSWSADRYGLQL